MVQMHLSAQVPSRRRIVRKPPKLPKNTDKTIPKSLRRLMDKAAQATQARDFNKAIEKYKQLLRKRPQYAPAHQAIISLYDKLGRDRLRIPHLEALVRLDPKQYANMTRTLAQWHFDQGQYGIADARLHVYLQHCMPCEDTQLLRASIDLSMQALVNPHACTPQALYLPINAFFTQYFPSFTLNEDTLLFTARKQMSDEDLYISVQRYGIWQAPKALPAPIHSGNNEGAGVISADGRQLIFTACNRSDGFGSCDLYISQRLASGWSAPRNLGSTINSPYWESQPALALDGRQLYFSSNRPGGYGMRDLWTVALPLKEEKQIVAVPQNLGPMINTAGDELTPFVHANGSSLYFSSNGWPNMGGIDVYVSEQEKPYQWGQARNLGSPINDHHDQFGFSVRPAGDQAYYAYEIFKPSGWRQAKIYKVQLPMDLQPRQKNTLLTGSVSDAQTHNPLYSLLSLSVLGNAEALYRVRSDSITGTFVLAVPAQATYLLTAQSAGYIPQTLAIAPQQAPTTHDFVLNPIQIGIEQVLPHILFPSDEYVLDSISVTELKKMSFFLRLHPSVRIEISGHTDNTGSKQHNQQLSTNRAKAVYRFLQQDGTNPQRMRYQGYGSTKPILPNDTEENKASNRRISFQITDY